MKHIVTALVLVTLFISCKKNTEKEAVKQAPVSNEQQIQDYLAKNDLKATRSDSGLYYIINEEGTGAKPTPESNVTVAYKGYFLDGTVFDQSDANGISFGLNQVIKGWTEGIAYFKEGGSGTLFVPANLGYGDYDYSKIPGGSVLIFEVKLIKVN